MTATRKRWYTRWYSVALAVIALLAVVAVIVILVAFRPPISDQRVAEIVARIDGIAGTVSERPNPALAEADARFAAALEAFLAYTGPRPHPIVRLAKPEEAADAAELVRIADSASALLEALDAIPMEGSPPRLPKGLSPSFEASDVTLVFQVLARAYRETGRPEELVPLANRFLRVTALRDREHYWGTYASILLTLPIAEVMAEGASHAPRPALEDAVRGLKRVALDMGHLDRVIARQMQTSLEGLAAGVEDPSVVPDRPGGRIPFWRTSRYLRYQLAYHARACERYLDLPRDRGWSEVGAEYAAILMEAFTGLESLKTKVASMRVLIPESFFVRAAQAQEQSALTQAVLAAEIHRRNHGEYPNSIESVLSVPPTLPYPGVLTLTSDGSHCTVTVVSDTGTRSLTVPAPE